jgi:1-acyl-sn-glycerol-3-phosphate acyltransferase
MQRVVIEEPYNFIPPRFSRFWYRVARRILPGKLRKEEGISAVECVGAEKLRASLDAGHGIMLVPNHVRPCDPLILDSLAWEVGRPFIGIASWHVFMNSRLQRFLLPRVGGFSVYREGTDRESLKCCINTLAEGKHPLVIFAEGIISRSNDRLLNFMEGPSFMARAAAKKRDDQKVLIHPLFIRYFFEGDLERTLTPVLEEIEKRLSWQPQSRLPLCERIIKTGDALLALKELEYLHAPQSGTNAERLKRLIEFLLTRLEDQWLSGPRDGDPIVRAKRLRAAIVPGLVTGELPEKERAARWRDLADLYLVQQLHCYPAGYLEEPTPERLIETVDRYEEDLTDVARPHFPLRVVITVGDAIEVGPTRDRSEDADPVMVEIRRQMESLMESSKSHRAIEPTGTSLS